MEKERNGKTYDLEDRSARFAKRCRDFVKQLPKSIVNLEYAKQLIRSSGSQAANYIEANEALSKKDFLFRIKICRKETKESRLWLQLCDVAEKVKLDKDRLELIDESTQLRKIYTTIYDKSS